MKSWNELKWWESSECANTHSHLRWNQPGWQSVPEQKNVYRSLHETPFADVKCVIVGQDPYPTPGMANGLAFSVDAGIDRMKYPPSLRNIFTELCSDLHIPYPKSGDLLPWARRGVLLWNTALTTLAYCRGSHPKLWDALTKEVLSSIATYHRSVMFILWGNHAQSYLPLIQPSVEAKQNNVIVAVHPSPLSAKKGFFGSRPFSTTNAYLQHPIDWRL